MQVRVAKLADVSCGCLALLEASPAAHPIALVGSYDNNVSRTAWHILYSHCVIGDCHDLKGWRCCVQVYATLHGRPLGSFAAHDDAVSCLEVPPASDLVVTASWDCTVKLWRCLSLIWGPHCARSQFLPGKLTLLLTVAVGNRPNTHA